MFFAYNEFDCLGGAALGGLFGLCLDLSVNGILYCSYFGAVIGFVNIVQFLSYMPLNFSYNSYSSSNYNNSSSSNSSWFPSISSADTSISAKAESQSVSFGLF